MIEAELPSVVIAQETGGPFLSLALFAAVQESAFDTKRTLTGVQRSGPDPDAVTVQCASLTTNLGAAGPGYSILASVRKLSDMPVQNG